MTQTIKYIILGVILFIMQVLIAEFINIWPLLVLMVVPILIVVLPININFTLLMFTAVGFGLITDIFTQGITGVTASALLTMAVVRKPVMKLLIPKNFLDNSYYIMSKDISFARLLLINLLLYSIFFIVYLILDSIGNGDFFYSLIRFSLNLPINLILWMFLETVLIRQIIK